MPIVDKQTAVEFELLESFNSSSNHSEKKAVLVVVLYSSFQ
jgi:hypothetical protein